MNRYCYFILFLIILSKIKTTTYRCGTNDLKLNPYNIEPTKEEKERRRRLSSSYQPISIKVDFTPFSRPSGMTSQTFNRIKDIIEETLNEFKKFLLIQHVSIDLSNYLNTIKESCDVDEVSADYSNFLKNDDVVIFPSFYKVADNVLAAARFCLTESKRPIAGNLYLNPNLSFDIVNSDIYMKNLLLHEISHILVFHPILFDQLNMLTRKNSAYYITSTKALLKARQHFNCPTLSGIPLENQGGEGSAGSHWETQYMLGDYMISTDYSDFVLSDITLALFEDSGFYKVNYYSGGLFKFGKNKGCDFLNKKCIDNGILLSEEEFCNVPRYPICSGSKTFKGVCGIYDYSVTDEVIPPEYQYFDNPNYGGYLAANFCPVSAIQDSETNYFPDSCKVGTSTLHSDFGEKMGDNSFCFVSSLLPTSTTLNDTEPQTICYKVQCDSSKKQIIVSVGSQNVICPTLGGEIIPSQFKGSIICPKYYDICDFKDNVMCNDLYDCLTKKVEPDPESYDFEPDDEDFIRITKNRMEGKFIQINYFIYLSLVIYMIQYFIY